MLPCVRLWLWISAFASLAGWGLSAAGELNPAGYAVAFAVFAVFVSIFRKGLGFSAKSVVSGQWSKVMRRFRRPLPFCFGALAVLIFLGDSRAGQLHRSGVSRRARAAMAVARPLVLD